MAKVCQIKRNPDGSIDKVLSLNGKESSLYRDILKNIPYSYSEENDTFIQRLKQQGFLNSTVDFLANRKEIALGIWSKVYTKAFTNLFGPVNETELRLTDDLKEFLFSTENSGISKTKAVLLSNWLDFALDQSSNLKSILSKLEYNPKYREILINKLTNLPKIKYTNNKTDYAVKYEYGNVVIGLPQAKNIGEEEFAKQLFKASLQHILTEELKDADAGVASAKAFKLKSSLEELIFNKEFNYSKYSDDITKFFTLLFNNKVFIIDLFDSNVMDKILDIVSTNLNWKKGLSRDSLMLSLFSIDEKQTVLQKEIDTIKPSPAPIFVSFSTADSPIIDMLEQDKRTNNLKLDNTNKLDTFYTYVGGKLLRLTEFINKVFLIGRDKDIAESQALYIFKKANNPKPNDTDTVEYEGTNYTLEQLTSKLRKDYEIGATFGKIGHLYMQKAISSDPAIKATLGDAINALVNSLPNKKTAEHYFKFLKSDTNISKIMASLGIRLAHIDASITKSEEDKVTTEFEMFDKDLGIGTTGDLLVEYSDGQIGLVDWKTGHKFFNNLYTQNIIQYSSGIQASKVNIAKLELALRAFMIQKKALEQKNKPVRFRLISVVHLHEEYNSNVINVEMEDYLPIIEQWIKTTNPTLHKELNKRNLFKASIYGGKSGTLKEELDKNKNLPREERIQRLKNKLMQKILSKPEHLRTAEDNRFIRKKYEQIAELEKLGDTPLADDVDLSWFKRMFGNWYSVTSSRLQNFGQQVMRAKTKVRAEIKEIEYEHDKLLEAVKKEYLKENNVIYGVTNGYLGNINYKDFYAFLWEEKTSKDSTGFFMNLKDTYRDKNGNVKQMSSAQKAYRDYLKNTMNKLWKDVMGQTAFINKQGKEVTKAKAARHPEELPEDFMPRPPAEMWEFLFEGNSKDKASYLVYKAMSSFLESFNTINNNQFAGAVPVKYVGSFVSISEQLHTFSGEVAFKQFVTNLVNKKHMDEMAALSDGLKNYYQTKGVSPGQGDWSNTISFIQDHLLLDILDVKKEVNLTRKPMRIPRNKYTTELGLADRPVAFDSFILGLKSAVSAGAMWLKLVAAGFNAALILSLNFKKAMEGSWGKLAGLEDTEIEFTFSDFAQGIVTWTMSQFHSFIPNEEGGKLLAMAKLLDYLPENYDYRANPKSLVAPKNRLNTGMLFVAHKIGEDMGNYSILYSALKRMKTVDKDGKQISMWDAYKYNPATEQVAYDGGVRGVVERGDGSFKELRELENEEIIRLKRVSQKIHGGYRQEERIAMELTALGSVVMQFRKFLPAIIENAFQGRYKDNSLGFYKLKMDENGNPVLKEGKNVYEWQARVSEGRIMLLLKLVSSYFKIGDMRLFGDDKYNWDNLENEDKQNIRELLLTSMMILSWLMIRGSAVDDDDKEKAFFIRLDRLFLEDITQGYNPLDIARSIQSQGALFYQGFDFLQAFADFTLNGVIRGDTTQSGDMPGVNKMMRRIPPFSVIKDIEKYFGENKTGLGWWDFESE